MIAALSMLVVLGIAVWCYRTAEAYRLPGFAWAVGGVVVYYAGFLFWMHGVLRPFLGGTFRGHGFWTGIGMDLLSILFGAVCAVWFRSKVLMRKGQKPFESPM